jgi:hypothetical protein
LALISYAIAAKVGNEPTLHDAARHTSGCSWYP